jgi:hypothetical protein
MSSSALPHLWPSDAHMRQFASKLRIDIAPCINVTSANDWKAWRRVVSTLNLIFSILFEKKKSELLILLVEAHDLGEGSGPTPWCLHFPLNIHLGRRLPPDPYGAARAQRSCRQRYRRDVGGSSGSLSSPTTPRPAFRRGSPGRHHLFPCELLQLVIASADTPSQPPTLLILLGNGSTGRGDDKQGRMHCYF